MTNNEELYYLQDTRTIVGNCVSWWAINGKGYTCNLDKAHAYTKEEAFAQHQMRPTDVPWPKTIIDALSMRHFDHQKFSYPALEQYETNELKGAKK